MNQLAAANHPGAGRWEMFCWSIDQVWQGLCQLRKTPKPDSLAQRPAHVPIERVADFDFYRQPGLTQDLHRVWKDLQQERDIFWTPRYGGHWVVTRGEDIDAILRDFEHFSSSEFAIPRGSKTLRLLPIEADPPEHDAYRVLINPWFTPKAVTAMMDDIRALAAELIEGFCERGECEFVKDFSTRLPIVIFLRLTDLPLEDRDKLLAWTEAVIRPKNLWQRLIGFFRLNAYQDQWIRQRRAHPGDDLISQVVTATIDGRPLTHGEVHGVLTVLLLGGLDTVAAMLAFSARYLAEHPEQRRQLAENPALIPRAVDELMRRHGTVHVVRVVVRDYDYRGVHFKEGDQILVPTALQGLDERNFERPMEVDFNRPNAIHAAFGAGPHRCPGSYLARTEIKIFLEEWLKRIPEFSIKPGEQPISSPGPVNSMEYLPLAWPVK